MCALYNMIMCTDLGTVFEPFVPPEGDGVASLLSGKVTIICASLSTLMLSVHLYVCRAVISTKFEHHIQL